MTNKQKYDMFRKEVLDKDYTKLNESEFMLWMDYKDKLELENELAKVKVQIDEAIEAQDLVMYNMLENTRKDLFEKYVKLQVQN